MLDMRVIFMDISAGQGGLSSVEMEAIAEQDRLKAAQPARARSVARPRA
jgi:hypothetical protein